MIIDSIQFSCYELSCLVQSVNLIILQLMNLKKKSLENFCGIFQQ